MLRSKPALAIMIGGLVGGAMIAQAVPTDPVGASPRPWTQTAAEDYPEIVGITYETIPGAASDPYNFTHRFQSYVSADANDLAPAVLDDISYDDVPAYDEPDYAEDRRSRHADTQLIEDEVIIPVEDEDVAALTHEDAQQPTITLSIG